MLHFPTHGLRLTRSLPKVIWSPSAGRCVALTKVTLEGLAATKKQVNLTGTTTMRIVGGKIAEMWNNLDALGLLQQIGVVARAQGA